MILSRARSQLWGIRLRRRLSTRAAAVLSALDIPTSTELSGVYDGQWRGAGDIIQSVCPTTGEILAHVKSATPQELHDAIEKSREAYNTFRHMPPPRRGEILRQLREALAAKVNSLASAGCPHYDHDFSGMIWAHLYLWRWGKYEQKEWVKCKSS